MTHSILVPLTAQSTGPFGVPTSDVLPFGIAALALICGVFLIRLVVKETLRFAERRQLYKVLGRLAERGELSADRMEEMLTTARTGVVRRSADPTQDRAMRIGFVLLALSMGFFAAAAFSGEDELMIPACLVGGLGLGLSGMRAARREIESREGSEGPATQVALQNRVGVGTPP